MSNKYYNRPLSEARNEFINSATIEVSKLVKEISSV